VFLLISIVFIMVLLLIMTNNRLKEVFKDCFRKIKTTQIFNKKVYKNIDCLLKAL